MMHTTNGPTAHALPAVIVIGAWRWQLAQADPAPCQVITWLARNWSAMEPHTRAALQRDLGAAAVWEQDEEQMLLQQHAMVVSAVQYYLGRSTAAVWDVCRWLDAVYDELDTPTRHAITQAIRIAQATQRLGMDVDAAAWRAVLQRYTADDAA